MQETGGSDGMSSKEYQVEEHHPQPTYDTQWVTAISLYGRSSRLPKNTN